MKVIFKNERNKTEATFKIPEQLDQLKKYTEIKAKYLVLKTKVGLPPDLDVEHLMNQPNPKEVVRLLLIRVNEILNYLRENDKDKKTNKKSPVRKTL